MRLPRLKQRRHRAAEWLSSLGLDLTLELPLALEGIAQWAGWTYLGTPATSPKLLYAGGRRSSRLGPTTEFPTFRVDSSPYGRGIEPATTILKAVCFTRPAIALLLCGRICSYKKNMFARTSYVGVSASNATGKAARLEPGIGVGSRELCILLLR